MSIASCCPSSRFARLSQAAAKSASARLRRLGLLRTEVNWAARASVCERCPLRVVERGTSYCGRPLLEQVARDPMIDGCGCPTIAKAKDPAEHCPINAAHRPATRTDDACTCKWCAIAP